MMAFILASVAVVGAATMWRFARSPLGRAIGCSVAGFAEASRAAPGVLR